MASEYSIFVEDLESEPPIIKEKEKNDSEKSSPDRSPNRRGSLRSISSQLRKGKFEKRKVAINIAQFFNFLIMHLSFFFCLGPFTVIPFYVLFKQGLMMAYNLGFYGLKFDFVA